MKHTSLVLTLTLLLSNATTVRVIASIDIPTVNSPLNNLTGQPSANPGATTNATVAAVFQYGNDNPPQPLATDEIGNVGGSQPHVNLLPFIISFFALPY